MKKYPKVPRYELDFVPSEIFTSKDMVLLEKMDGMNFRFTLYEERYHNEYSEQVLEFEPDDGDIIFGTKSVVRGVVSDGVDAYASELKTGINKLQEISKNSISSYQDKFGPLIWFCENMVPHTLDYNYEENPPPKLIGFDVYAMRQDNRKKDDFNPNPYNEEFIGYLRWNKVKEMFENIGIKPTRCIATQENFENGFRPEEFQIPKSQYSNVQAEGVVIRSDNLKRRAKYVRESFREMHKSGMGSNANKNKDPEQWILDSIITNRRIRKTIRKVIKEDNIQFNQNEEFIDKISKIVLYDGWSEEFSEIRTIDDQIKPSNLHKPTYKKVESVIKRMHLMSTRTGEKPEDTWMMLDQKTNTESQSEDQVKFNYTFDDISDIERALSEEIEDGTDSEEAIVDEFIDRKMISKVAGEVSESQSLGGWAVTPMADHLEDILWTSEIAKKSLWRLHIEFNPSKIRNILINRVKQYIESETGYDLDKGGGSWNPDNSEYSFEGFENL
jgi:hypothetical protein